MTDQTWNPDDFRFDFPDVPRYEGMLVAMPIQHKVEKVRRYLVDNLLPEVQRCLAVNAELSGLLLCLACTDYLAGFHAGRKTAKPDYTAFLRRYFPAKYDPHVDDIYDQLRSGLMHNLTAANPWNRSATTFLIHANSPDHLEATQDGRLVFSVDIFQIDIYRAWRMYTHDMIMRADQHEDLIHRFH